MDNFIEKAIDEAYNASHFHTLARLLTPTHACCLKRFKVTKIQSHLHSDCYLKKRLAQAYRNILDTRIERQSPWFSYEWTLLVMCLAHRSISRRLDPHRMFKRFSLPFKLNDLQIHINLISDYKTGFWRLDKKLLMRQIKHFRKTKDLKLTPQEATHIAHKQLSRAKKVKSYHNYCIYLGSMENF